MVEYDCALVDETRLRALVRETSTVVPILLVLYHLLCYLDEILLLFLRRTALFLKVLVEGPQRYDEVFVFLTHLNGRGLGGPLEVYHRELLASHADLLHCYRFRNFLG